jgi:O-antigen ligase
MATSLRDMTPPPPLVPRTERQHAPLFRRPERPAGQPASFHALRVFLFLLYANVALWMPALEVVRPAQITVIVTALLLVYEGMSGRRRLGLIWPESPLLLAFIVAAFLSIGTALWPGHAFTTSVELTKCAVAYFLVALATDTVARLKSVLWTLVLGGLFPAVGTLIFFATGRVEEGRAGWLGIFANPNDAAYSLVILIPLAYALGSLSGWGGRLVVAVALLTYAGAIYTTFSRGGLLGFFAVLMVIGLRVRSHVMRLAAIGLMVMGVVAVLYFWKRSAGFESLGADATVNQRFITVKAGLEMFADHPLLGVGAGCSVVGFTTYAPSGVLTHKALMVHNTFVQALSEVGLLGSVPYFLLFGAAVAGAHRLARRRPGGDPELPVLAAGIQASIVGLTVCSLAGGYVLSWFPYILFGLVSAARRIASTATSSTAMSEAA